jgi:hypothetical protein
MKHPVAPLRLAAIAILVAACGAGGGITGPGSTSPTATGQPGTTTPPPGGQTGTATGAQVRVVNLYSENGQPVEIDVYAQNAITGQFGRNEVFKAAIPYGQASAPFDPGQADGADPGKIRVELIVYRHGEHEDSLVAAASHGELEPTGMATLTITADEGLSGEMTAFQSFFFEDLRGFSMENADSSKALLLVNSWAMPDSDDYLYASIGDGCLENAFAEESDLTFGQAVQPGSLSFAPMRVDPGAHQLTFHRQAPGEDLASCETEPLYPAVPIDVAANEHDLLYLFTLDPGGPAQTLVLPGGA